jgi:hypothetical protein
MAKELVSPVVVASGRLRSLVFYVPFVWLSHGVISELANSNVGWVSDSVTHAGVGFRASTQPTSTYILFNYACLLTLCLQEGMRVGRPLTQAVATALPAMKWPETCSSCVFLWLGSKLQ